MRITRETPVTCAIGRKTAFWIPAPNKYILAAAPLDTIVKLIVQGHETREVVDRCIATLGLPEAEALQLESQARELLSEMVDQIPRPPLTSSPRFLENGADAPPFSEKHYRVMGSVFRVGYASAETEFIIHPKFAHLEIPSHPSPDHCFDLNHGHGHYTLRVDEEWIGIWPEKEGHIFSGQFSMQLLEKAYGKTADEWMAVLHAAGVSNGRHCLLFAGDSGAGKSTLSALLMSRGLDVLADDFLPLESATTEVCRFPAAISIKKQAIDLLMPSFPELGSAKAYHFPAIGKTVRYLPVGPVGDARPARAVCRGMVFVNYQPNIAFHLEEIPQEDAFVQLVPDAWIHPSPENARKFLEWFSRLRCYQLHYSDNERMAESLHELLDGLA